MEPEGSLPLSQVPANCPYPEPARSSTYPHIPLPENPFMFLEFHVPNLISLFRCLGRTKASNPVPGTCSWFARKSVFSVRCCQHLAQPPSWRTTPCQMSATAYSIYSQLPSILEAVLPSAAWGRAMPWRQGSAYHGFYSCSRLENKAPNKCTCLTWESGLALRQPSPLLVCSTSRLLWHGCCASTVVFLCRTQSKTSQCCRWPIWTSCLAVDTAKLWHAIWTGKNLPAAFQTNIF
jgi:hypothetical protein